MQRRNRTGATVAAVALLALMTVAAPAVAFPDVSEGSPHARSIDRLVGVGVIRGYPDGTFRPHQGVSQRQLDNMLDRVCEAGGWIGHYGEYGSVPATRADTAAFTGSWIETVQHFLDLHPTVLDDDLPDQFPDLGAWTRSRRAINSLAVEGVITGYPDGTFKPGRIVTRAQAATILVRAMDWLRGQGLNVERAQVKYGCDFPDANAPS